MLEPDFRRYFEEFGKITDAVVMIDRETQRSRGFGFITFEDEVGMSCIEEPPKTFVESDVARRPQSQR